MKKDALRIKYKQLRSGITAATKDKYEDLMLIMFQQLQFGIPDIIMSYAPYDRYNEYDPCLVEQYCRFRHPGLQLAYPVVQEIDRSMQAVAADEATEFSLNKYYIPEPINGTIIAPASIGLVIVPLLAYDTNGNRVGFGKGYYDRFLALCNEDVVKIGFSFFGPEASIEDVNAFDIPLDLCITPNGIHTF